MKEDRKEQRKQELQGNQVQATSVLEVTHIENATLLKATDIQVAAVLHEVVRFGDVFRDALENHAGKINKIIKEKAALYFSSMAPTTIQDIRDKLKDVVVCSLEIFSLVCSAWKYQNCNQFEDEDGTSLVEALNNVRFMGYALSGIQHQFSAADFTKTCDWNISNADWKKSVLKHLQSIYLSKTMQEFIFTFFGHFIKFNNHGEGTERLVTFDDYSLSNVRNDVYLKGATKDTFIEYLDFLQDTVDAAYNAYPFMDNLIEALGLYSPDRAYDFTRDLKQSKLNIIYDSTNSVFDMLSSIQWSDNFNDTAPEAGFAPFRHVNVFDYDGSYFEVYKDDPAAAKELKYTDRVFINTYSMANAMRGNTVAINITSYYQVKPITPGATTKDYIMLNPYFVRIDGSLSLTAAEYGATAFSNDIKYQLRMPLDSITIDAEGVQGNPGDINRISAPVILYHPSSGDYLISSDDIESVISDAVYYALFDKENEEVKAVTNTLGNNGTNN